MASGPGVQAFDNDAFDDFDSPKPFDDDEVELIAHPVEDPWADKEAFIAAVGAAVASAAAEGADAKAGRVRASKAKARTRSASKAKEKSKAKAKHGPAAVGTAKADGAAAAATTASAGRHAAHAAEGTASYEEPEAAAHATSLKSKRTGGRHGSAESETALATRTALATTEAAEAPSVKVRTAKKTRSRKARVAIFSSVAAVLLAAAGVYAYGVYHFTDHIMPNTTVADIDLSGMEVSEAKAALDERIASYKCSISGSDFYLMVRGNDIDFTVDTQGIVDRIMGSTDKFRWPLLMASSRSYDFQGLCSWNDEKLREVLQAYTEPHNEGVTHSADAYVAYSAPDKQYIVVPEVAGNVYEFEDIVEQTRASISRLEYHVDLDDSSLILPTLYRDDEKLANDAETCNGYLGADFDLVVNVDDRWSDPGRVLDHIDGSMLSQWIVIEDGEIFFDEQAMKDWCWDYAKSHMTYGTKRTYTRPDGETFTLDGGTYGWKYDVNTLYNLLLDNIMAGTTGKVVVPMSQTAWVWTDEEHPSDIGDTYIDITISTQIVRYIVDGVQVREAPTVSGDFRTGLTTPYGAFYIVYKLRNTHLRGENLDGTSYDVPVSYWMSFIGNDYGLHDHPYRYQFGYPIAFRGGGSHGCCNLPYKDAQYLYATTVLGCPVLIHW